MVEDIILDATQYSNLKTTYSEKNNIDNVKGVEYRVLGTNVIDFAFENGNNIVDESGKITINYSTSGTPIFADINGKPIPPKLIKPNIKWLSIPYGKQKIYLRAEEYRIKGTFRAYTESVIQDVNTISASCQITYNNYENTTRDLNNQPLKDNYSSFSLEPAYEFLRKPNNLKKENETTNTKLPSANAIFNSKALAFIGTNSYVVSNSSIANLSKPRIVSTQGRTTVEVDYEISIWYAYNNILITQWGFFDAYFFTHYLNNATSIQFQVQANGIDTTTNEFKYGDGQYKQYGLESNELMQFEENQAFDTRQSYLTSQKMLNKSQINRMIISLDLLKCDKIVKEIVRPQTENEPQFSINRYLNTGDLIKIKDQNGDFIGQYYDKQGVLIVPYFEIISLHGHWDGTFHTELVCKQKL